MKWYNTLTRLAFHHLLENWKDPAALVGLTTDPIELAAKVHDQFVIAFAQCSDPFVSHIGHLAIRHVNWRQIGDHLTAMVDRQRQHEERRAS